jgi:hypothetical protein
MMSEQDFFKKRKFEKVILFILHLVQQVAKKLPGWFVIQRF